MNPTNPPNPHILSPSTIVAMALRAQMPNMQKKAHSSGQGGRCLKCKRKQSGGNPKNLCHCEEKKDTETESSPVV